METEKQPHKLAFAAANGELTWAGLKETSDRICAAIKQARIPKGHPVLVYGDKETCFLATLVACLREGLPFITLSAELPVKRMELIREKTGSEVLFYCGDAAPVNTPVKINARGEIEYTRMPAFSMAYPDQGYIIFTSGSGGEPKGVCISNRNLSSFTRWFISQFAIDKACVFINQASFLFDIALADLFATLQAGASAIFNTAEVARSVAFIERIRQHEGNFWNSTPSFLSLSLAQESFHTTALPAIKQFVLSGEQLTGALVRKVKDRFPQAAFSNAYGPTETTIFASCVHLTDDMLQQDIMPIAPVGEGSLLIENGEIIITNHVGSYLNNEAGGFTERNGTRAFRTGDRVTVHDDHLFFAGRNDEQVKLNGFRIELNEIRVVLEKQNHVRQAACLCLQVNGKANRIIAFVETEKSETAALKKKLTETLPAYMVPSEILAVREMPHTPSFKIDKKKLLERYLAGEI